jgi:hypothetical protein
LSQTYFRGDDRAGRELSLYYKRRGEWSKAVELWEAMARERSLFAAIELAKYHEHRLRAPAAALKWLHHVAAWELTLGEEQLRELRRRQERLERKCRKAKGSGASQPDPEAERFSLRFKAFRERWKRKTDADAGQRWK